MTVPRKLLHDPGVRAGVSRALLWVAFGALALWTREPRPWMVVAALPALGLSALLAARGIRRLAAAAVLAGAIGVALHADREYRAIHADWESYWVERRAEATRLLESEFGALVALGDASLERLLRAASGTAGGDSGPLGDSVAAIARESGLAAAVYGPGERLVAWRGKHHGRFPKNALEGGGRHAYGGSPLFSYLYFVSPLASGEGSAVIAALLHSELPAPNAAGLGDFATRFESATGERIAISRYESAATSDGADFLWPATPLVAVRIQEPDGAARAAERRGRGTGTVLALAALAWLLESLGGPRGSLPFSLSGLALAALVVPLEYLPIPPEFRDPAHFQPAGPFSPGLGRLLLLAVAAMPLAGLAARRWHLGSAVAPVAVAVGYPLALHWTGGAASPDLMGGSDLRWIAAQGLLTLIIALGTWPLLSRSSPGGGAARPRMVAAAIVASAALSVGVGFGVRVGPGAPPALAALWCVPAWLFARGVATRNPLSHWRWFFACWLAGTATLPFAWSKRTEARQEIAERQMARLGVTAEPFADDLVRGFARHADSLDRAGAREVELLYRSWVGSGLAERGAPIFLTLWSADGEPVEELRLGVTGNRPPAVDARLAELRAIGAWSYRRPVETDVHHLLGAPLSGGRIVTGAVPPRRSIGVPSTLGPLFASVEEAGNEEFLTLVRVDREGLRPIGGSVAWRRNDEGWRGEGLARYPDGLYSVYYTISIPNVQVMLARATLVLAATVAPLMMLWLIAATTLGHRSSSPIDWRGLIHSFRARVTWTLFGFFVLSAVLFGTLAYRALAGGSERTAKSLAERVVDRTAANYAEEGGSLERLATRVGADLLEYRDGELAAGSVGELVELGLYEGWLDPAVSDALESGEQLSASTVESLGGWRYVVAHRRLADGAVVAAPAPLPAGAAALRRRDVADLLIFAVVLGPVLSLGLALVVGRALSKPIQTLRVASEKVGRGNLEVSLPEDRVDEFGSVFAAFNRMVRRLGNARRELLRTTRRTEAIVEGAATGVIAVNTRGLVTVANPRAERLLGTPLAEGSPMPRERGHAPELAGWLDEALESGLEKADADFEWSARRIRARARRIAWEGKAGGVVVNLEDVTAGLESERILAWGEMAKQVAHEVKNPLTPIKLSVQHLRRAWRDRPRDFGQLLERNAGAILKEIDRLAAIATSFSKLSSPGSEDRGPLVAVDAAEVAREVMDLYLAGDESGIRVVGDVPAGMPKLACRPDELKEVLLNLLENSREAMPQGGVARVRGVPPAGPGAMAALLVEDEGVGIPAELLPRIFEPQFSTRSKGSGLGLAIAKRLVDSWEGEIEAESEVGWGTRMIVRLRALPGDDGRGED